MKTFESFLYEGVGDKLGNMSDEEFASFQKGRTAAEAENFRKAREKAKGKDKGSALAIRKPEEKKEKTAAPKEKAAGFNNSRPPKPGRPQPTTAKKAQPAPALGAEKEKEKKEKEEKKDRKKLDLMGPLGYVAGKVRDAAVSTATTDTNKKGETYVAQ